MIGRLSGDKKAGLFGIGWTTLAHFVTLAIRLTSMLILTRLLAPEAYGIFTAAFVAVVMLHLVTDIGVRPGLMRHPDGMQPHFLGTGWLISLRRGILLSICLFWFSFLLPSINHHPETGLLLRVLAIQPIIHALQNPTFPMLYKEMQYREISIIEVGQMLCGSIVGVLVAWLITPTVWALVCGVLAQEISFVILSYLFAPQPTRPRWDPQAAKELSHFAMQVLFNTLVMALWLYSDRFLALNFVDEKDLGLYTIAWTLAEHVERLISRITDVYFSMLSRQPDPQIQIRMHQKVSQKLALLIMPILMIGILLAPLAVRILYDERYQGAQILFAILMARLMFRTMGMVQAQYFLVRAEVYLATRCYLVTVCVQITAYFLLVPFYGVVGMAYATVLSTGVYAFLQNVVFWQRRELNWWPFLIATIWMVLGIILVMWIVDPYATPLPTTTVPNTGVSAFFKAST